MRACLVTLGDPQTLSGGYLFHLRLAELAPERDFELSFFSFLDRAFPLPIASGAAMVKIAASADVVVVDSIAAWCAGPWLGRVSEPIVGMLHQLPGGTDGGRLRRRCQAPLDRRAYRHMDRILVASPALRDALSEDIDPGRIGVVAPGRDVARPSERSPDLRIGRMIALLSVGNWVPHKGTVELLQSLQAVPPGHATLHLVGRTDVNPRYTARVQAMLAEPGIRDRVVVHGPLPRERVAAMYVAADAFVLPSFVETYGTVYGEAMASGLPVVGWDAGNLPHLARDGVSGLIVPTDDVAGLARALVQIAEDEGLRTRLAEGAKERAQGLPTWDETADLFFSELRQVVTASKSSTAP
jgi:glycosyltransferase involved in cell wall biosynthesis